MEVTVHHIHQDEWVATTTTTTVAIPIPMDVVEEILSHFDDIADFLAMRWAVASVFRKYSSFRKDVLENPRFLVIHHKSHGTYATRMSRVKKYCLDAVLHSVNDEPACVDVGEILELKNTIATSTYVYRKWHKNATATGTYVDRKWYKLGRLHRDGDKPAHLYRSQNKLSTTATEEEYSKVWYQDGQYHREHGPALIYICAERDYPSSSCCLSGGTFKVTAIKTIYFLRDSSHKPDQYSNNNGVI